MSTSLETWVSAAFTVAMLTMVFARDNPVYRFAEHVFIGVAAAHAVVIGWGTVRTLGLNPLLQDGRVVLVIPLALGVLLYTRYFKQVAWLGRFGMAMMVASGAGVVLRGSVQANFLDQLRATMIPLNSLNNVLLVLGVFASMSYFFLTTSYARHFRGSVTRMIPVFGKWVMMVAFGASFGNAVMGRLSLLIGRMQFLLRDVLGLI